MRTEDGHIVDKCLNGEPAAFGLLVDKYRESIYALAYSKLGDFHDAEDITQEVFIKAYQKLRMLKRWDRILPWLYAITSNLCKNWIRSQSRRPDRRFMEDEEPEALNILSLSSYRSKQNRESLHESVQEALNSLPGIYRQVLTLHYLGGMSGEEIATFLCVPVTAIWKRLSRARGSLREEVINNMAEVFRENRLPAGFTFSIVETVKGMRINPIPGTRILPWGGAIATCIAIFTMLFSQNLAFLSGFGISRASSFGDIRILNTGEYPVDIIEKTDTEFIMNLQEGGDRVNYNKTDAQSTVPDPRSQIGKWRQMADTPTARACATAEVDGIIYAIGGTSDPNDAIQLSTLEAFDPKSNTWIKKADMPTPRMNFCANALC